MENKLKELVNQINEVSNELKGIENELNIKEQDRLLKVIEIAKKGIKFNKISKTKSCYCPSNGNYKSNDIEYFKENDKCIKGIIVDTDRYWENKYSTGYDYKEKQLFLMQDGTFRVYDMEASTSCFQGSTDTYERYYISNQDIFQFDMDEIVDSIISALENRLDKLGTRCKTQKARLEKINKLVIE